jgi:hypothetical protein
VSSPGFWSGKSICGDSLATLVVALAARPVRSLVTAIDTGSDVATPTRAVTAEKKAASFGCGHLCGAWQDRFHYHGLRAHVYHQALATQLFVLDGA